MAHGFHKKISILICACALPLSFSREARAQSADCFPNPYNDVRKQITNILPPFKQTFFNPNNFNLKPLDADIAWMSNQVDPPEKRLALMFKVRISAQPKHNNQLSWFSLNNVGVGAYWQEDGNLNLQDTRRNEVNDLLGFPNHPLPNIYTPEEISKMPFDVLRDRLMTLDPISAAEEQYALEHGILPTHPPMSKEMISNFTVFAAYLKVISPSNRGGIENSVKDLKDKLTTEQKISLVSLVGSEANHRYDKERAGIYGKNDEGAVAISKKFGKSIPYDAVLTNLRTTNLLGVCRDIVPAQTQLLKQLGFDDTYSMAYNAGGPHVAILTRNPDNPKQMIQINYDDIGTSDLKQGMRSLTRKEDYSTNYTFYDYKGKAVANLPSEMGALMMEGAGGNIRTLDPFLIRPQGSLVTLSLDSKGKKIPVYAGQTSDGTLVAGVGYTVEHGNPETDTFSYTNTQSLAYQQKNSKDYSNKDVKYDAVHIMDVFSGQLATKWKAPFKSETTQARATLTGTLNVDGAKSDLSGRTPMVETLGFSATGNAEAGVEVKYASPDGNTKILGRAATQVGLGSSDLSAGDLSHFYHNLTYVNVKGETPIIPDKLRATLDAAVGFREFGPQLFVQAGVSNENHTWSASGGYQGALKKNALTIAPGSEQALFLQIDRSLGNSLDISASILAPTDFKFSSAQGQVTLKGSMTELLKKKKKRTPSGN